MKMKKYSAPSLAEAMKMVSADLGEDAIILNSRVVVKKKFFGLIKKKSFEVTAGIDTVTRPTMPKIPTFQPPVKEVVKPVEPKSVLQSDDAMISSELKKEIADLKLIMQSMNRQSTRSQYPNQIVQYVEYLDQQELNEELITAIGDELFVHYKNKDVELTDDVMREVTKKYLAEKMAGIPLAGLSYERKYINILGPTGVGKTTTIAKMAARAVLEKKKKVGFITTDTYRIAAIEQLKTYAGLLQAPVEIVYNSADYENAIRKLAHLDMIFIDTAGRNYKEAKYVEDLRNLIKFDNRAESYLVLALTAKERDLEMIVEQFSGLSIDKFIFTKLDETNSIGAMFNLMIKYKKGLAYYTNGQEVPEDIEQPNLESLFELFFQGEK